MRGVLRGFCDKITGCGDESASHQDRRIHWQLPGHVVASWLVMHGETNIVSPLLTRQVSVWVLVDVQRRAGEQIEEQRP